MPQTPAQLALLAEQIQLSLLERQRNRSLNLDTSSQTASIRASLDALSTGIAALVAQGKTFPALATQHANLLADLEDRPRPDPAEQAEEEPVRKPATKSVRFRDTDDDDDADAADPARDALFKRGQYADDPASQPYSDDPEDPEAQTRGLDNQQIHEQHRDTLRGQDEQLDVLGASVRRQRLLGISIGNELEEQTGMLDDVEAGVDRHQTALDRGRERLGKFARKAKGNMSWITIGVLSLILLILIIIR